MEMQKCSNWHYYGKCAMGQNVFITYLLILYLIINSVNFFMNPKTYNLRNTLILSTRPSGVPIFISKGIACMAWNVCSYTMKNPRSPSSSRNITKNNQPKESLKKTIQGNSDS